MARTRGTQRSQRGLAERWRAAGYSMMLKAARAEAPTSRDDSVTSLAAFAPRKHGELRSAHHSAMNHRRKTELGAFHAAVQVTAILKVASACRG